MQPNDVVRFKNKNMDSAYGIGLVRYRISSIGPPAYLVTFQDGITIVYEDRAIVIGTYVEVWQHCHNLSLKTFNGVEDSNYCNEDECDCAICPFNKSKGTLGEQSCVRDGYRKAWYYERCDHLVENARQVANFLMSTYKS